MRATNINRLRQKYFWDWENPRWNSKVCAYLPTMPTQFHRPWNMNMYQKRQWKLNIAIFYRDLKASWGQSLRTVSTCRARHQYLKNPEEKKILKNHTYSLPRQQSSLTKIAKKKTKNPETISKTKKFCEITALLVPESAKVKATSKNPNLIANQWNQATTTTKKDQSIPEVKQQQEKES